MNKGNFKHIKNISIGIFFVLLIIIFFYLLLSTRDNDLVKNIKEFKKNDIKVLYISDKKHYSNYPIELFEKYTEFVRQIKYN